MVKYDYPNASEKFAKHLWEDPVPLVAYLTPYAIQDTLWFLLLRDKE